MRRVIILFFMVIFFSCKTIETSPSMMDCVECLDHQYQQVINDTTSTLLTLASGTYCLGDSVWLMTDNTYWAIMDNELITIMSESPFCNLLELVE